jgi:hypothetical protein
MKIYNIAFKEMLLGISAGTIGIEKVVYLSIYLKEIMQFRVQNLLSFQLFESERMIQVTQEKRLQQLEIAKDKHELDIGEVIRMKDWFEEKNKDLVE